MPIAERKFLSKFLVHETTKGKNAILDYAVSTDYELAPPDGRLYTVCRMLIHIVDGAAILGGSYGAGITLNNGMEIFVTRDGEIINDLTDGIPILTNDDWARYDYDVRVSAFGAGVNYIHSRWSFEEVRTPIRLRGSLNEKLIVRFGIDDYTGLMAHHFLAQGSMEDE